MTSRNRPPASNLHPHPARRSTQAFTMLEVMVASAIGLVMLGVLYNLFQGSTVIHRKVEGKNEAVQSALLAIEAIKRDLKQLVSLPVNRDAQGRPVQRPGDHLNPVAIGAAGNALAFYIPAKDVAVSGGALTATPVNFRVLPVDGRQGLYYLARLEGTDAQRLEEAGSVALDGRKNVGAVYLQSLQFRVLSPSATEPDRRSPDQNYYVETKLTAADSEGKEKISRVDLTPLDMPSQMSKVPHTQIDPAHSYTTAFPLQLPVFTPSFTPTETAAIDRLRDAADQYERDPSHNPAPLENAVRDVINQLNNGPNGTRNVLANPNNRTVPNGPVRALPPTPGQPIAVSVPGGQVNIPTAATPPGTPQGATPGSPPGDGDGQVQAWWTVTRTQRTFRMVNGQMVEVSNTSATDGATQGFSTGGTSDQNVNATLQGAQDWVTNNLTQRGVRP